MIVTRLDQARADAFASGKYLVTERICRARDGRLVSEADCLDGGNLLYTPGMEIRLEEARAVGLIPEVKATPVVEPAAPLVEPVAPAKKRK